MGSRSPGRAGAGRGFRAIVAALGLTGGLLASAPSAAGSSCVALPGLDDRCERWIGSYEFGDNWNGFYSDSAPIVAARPMAAGGGRVFLTTAVNHVDDPGQELFDIQTVALSASDGRELWSREVMGAQDVWDMPFSLALSPDETTLYMTGILDYPLEPNAFGLACPLKYGAASPLTIAYDAASGTERWRTGGGQATSSLDVSFGSALSSDGTLLYTAGARLGVNGEPDWEGACDHDFAVNALDAATGQELWSSVIVGNRGGFDRAVAVAVTPDASTLVAIGATNDGTTRRDYLTVAFDAVDDPDEPTDHAGEILWRAKYDGGYSLWDDARGMAMAANGSAVYVTGQSDFAGDSITFGNSAFATVAYDVATGERLWDARYQGQADGRNLANAIAAAPTGGRVFVTGQVVGLFDLTYDFATLAYDGGTGQLLWTKIYRDPVSNVEEGYDLAVSPDGSRLYVTGQSGPGAQTDASTIAYDAATGAHAWIARMNNSPLVPETTIGRRLTLSRDGKDLYMSGRTVNEIGLHTDGAVMADHWHGLAWSYKT